jgi:hypothetical protein
MGQTQTRPSRSAGDAYDGRMTSSDSYETHGGIAQPPRFVRGIVNEGQSCFVNATLQVRENVAVHVVVVFLSLNHRGGELAYQKGLFHSVLWMCVSAMVRLPS